MRAKFLLFQDPKLSIPFVQKAKLLLQTMPLVGVWSENLHHLRTSLGITCSFQLLKYSTCSSVGRTLSTGRCKLHSIGAKVEGNQPQSQSEKSCDIRLELLDGKYTRTTNIGVTKKHVDELKAYQYYDIQKKHVEKKDSLRLATIFVFDIETTGFSKNTHRIIEFALQDLGGGKNSTFQTLVNPERYVPNAEIHGISNHMVNRPGIPRWRDLVPMLLQYVRSRQQDGTPVLWIAHNGRRFDVPFIIKEFSRCFVEIPSDWLFLDTLPLARQIVKPDGSKLASSSLGALREYYGIPLSGSAHRAMSDVNTLSLVLQRMTFDLKLPVSGLLERSFKASDIPE
ncbi:exonuclease DPD1, chloroplastic/mitochondrial isoform X1 [Amborella trichopoda]|nr:exonuclease DPD1, chloroplastic/mitochondrial isoform X1 [Amborella trichopoda]XP_020529739.1 exonuclease DPD1, chloroplastic/mitochondrial isoform X1 [Amborella trichopoda]XP_020529740.1 exonuclease DPD1, chloroplastic/mitochondrial isoform X1 [Amborella trichopoda]XP_020529741.1 exonuclease DPD1, chloroplastic/mitochondrial isoform X1 [Amborella trichopoda]XP_020529742.1 exonuclease DPD1, chloroplastic/mitochondrial isoform X1 [Amborella trichopoda]XP_020529744.1 exonuclease DPD1, chlorop|eukprot:XP_006855354.2 exonuclease DPD1, chloroplastic/mitochondrial isoform X1 [Amborella trichopoda]